MNPSSPRRNKDARYDRPARALSSPYRSSCIYVTLTVLFLLWISLPIQPLLFAEELPIGKFSILDPADGLPHNWEPLQFPNIERHTLYRPIRETTGKNIGTAIQAVSDNAASGLIYRKRIDPNRFPIIQWQWKVTRVLEKGDLTQKKGDDYAARIYVAFAFEPEKATWWQRFKHKSASAVSGKELPGTALNYIWANKAPKGVIAPNPYAREAMMIAVQSGNDQSGQWLIEQRNLLEDYKQAFKRQPPEIIGIALMTDTDNTQEQTTAYYGDIVLKSDNHVKTAP